jgi:hypothetical protein
VPSRLPLSSPMPMSIRPFGRTSGPISENTMTPWHASWLVVKVGAGQPHATVSTQRSGYGIWFRSDGLQPWRRSLALFG